MDLFYPESGLCSKPHAGFRLFPANKGFSFLTGWEYTLRE